MLRQREAETERCPIASAPCRWCRWGCWAWCEPGACGQFGGRTIFLEVLFEVLVQVSPSERLCVGRGSLLSPLGAHIVMSSEAKLMLFCARVLPSLRHVPEGKNPTS